MKITKTQLKEMIREEVSRLNEKKAVRVSKPEELLKGRTVKSVKKDRMGDIIVAFDDGLIVKFGIGFSNSGDSVYVYKEN